MVHQIHVEGMADSLGHHTLEDVMGGFSVEALICHGEPRQDPQAVAVDRKYLAVKRVEQYTSCGLRAHSRKTAKKRFRFLIGQVVKGGQRNSPKGLLNGGNLPLQTVQLYPGHPTSSKDR